MKTEQEDVFSYPRSAIDQMNLKTNADKEEITNNFSRLKGFCYFIN
jgi:hypothetical protein